MLSLEEACPTCHQYVPITDFYFHTRECYGNSPIRNKVNTPIYAPSVEYRVKNTYPRHEKYKDPYMNEYDSSWKYDNETPLIYRSPPHKSTSYVKENDLVRWNAGNDYPSYYETKSSTRRIRHDETHNWERSHQEVLDNIRNDRRQGPRHKPTEILVDEKKARGPNPNMWAPCPHCNQVFKFKVLEQHAMSCANNINIRDEELYLPPQRTPQRELHNEYTSSPQHFTHQNDNNSRFPSNHNSTPSPRSDRAMQTLSPLSSIPLSVPLEQALPELEKLISFVDGIRNGRPGTSNVKTNQHKTQAPLRPTVIMDPELIQQIARQGTARIKPNNLENKKPMMIIVDPSRNPTVTGRGVIKAKRLSRSNEKVKYYPPAKEDEDNKSKISTKTLIPEPPQEQEPVEEVNEESGHEEPTPRDSVPTPRSNKSEDIPIKKSTKNNTVTEEDNGEMVLVPCPHCDRKFAQNRVDKHVSICGKLKKRTPMPPPQRVPKRAPVSGLGGGGSGLDDLQKLKPWVEPPVELGKPDEHGRFQCTVPECERWFVKEAALRHIPICQRIFDKKTKSMKFK